MICALALLVGTCGPAFASNNGIELQALANSTNAIEVARRQIACTPNGYSEYVCYNRDYTEVPSVANGLLNAAWIPTTTKM